MLPTLVPIARLFAVNDWFIGRCVGDFLPADWSTCAHAGCDARWIVKHITVHRRRLMIVMGLPPFCDDWDCVFQHDSISDAAPADLDVTHMLGVFHAVHQIMALRWDMLTETHLSKPLRSPLPDGGNTVDAGIQHLLWHETFHIGQLGQLRCLAGKPPVA